MTSPAPRLRDVPGGWCPFGPLQEAPLTPHSHGGYSLATQPHRGIADPVSALVPNTDPQLLRQLILPSSDADNAGSTPSSYTRDNRVPHVTAPKIAACPFGLAEVLTTIQLLQTQDASHSGICLQLCHLPSSSTSIKPDKRTIAKRNCSFKGDSN